MLTPSTSRTPAHIVAKKTPMKLHAKIWAAVRQLLEPLHCEGCNITTDSYFTSLGLARDLLKAKKATLVGTIVTIRTNQVQLPAGRELYSSLVGFNISSCNFTSPAPRPPRSPTRSVWWPLVKMVIH